LTSAFSLCENGYECEKIDDFPAKQGGDTGMAIVLKLVTEKREDDQVKVIKFCEDDNEKKTVDPNKAMKDGFTISKDTLKELHKYLEYGQMYEAIARSHKSEFSDLD
jgi:hypothetical protein